VTQVFCKTTIDIPAQAIWQAIGDFGAAGWTSRRGNRLLPGLISSITNYCSDSAQHSTNLCLSLREKTDQNVVVQECRMSAEASGDVKALGNRFQEESLL
jgi:hypothetical protein